MVFVLSVSYILIVRSRDLMRFRFESLVHILHRWCCVLRQEAVNVWPSPFAMLIAMDGHCLDPLFHSGLQNCDSLILARSLSLLFSFLACSLHLLGRIIL